MAWDAHSEKLRDAMEDGCATGALQLGHQYMLIASTFRASVPLELPFRLAWHSQGPIDVRVFAKQEHHGSAKRTEIKRPHTGQDGITERLFLLGDAHK
eukprot:6484090-Amphidinium_carterae.1